MAEKINNVELSPLVNANAGEGQFVQILYTPEELDEFIKTHRASLTPAEVSALKDFSRNGTDLGDNWNPLTESHHRIMVVALEGEDTAHLTPKGALKCDKHHDGSKFEINNSENSGPTILDLTTTGKPIPVQLRTLKSFDFDTPEAGKMLFNAAMGKPQDPAPAQETGPLSSIKIPSLKGVNSIVKSSPTGTSFGVEKQSVVAAAKVAPAQETGGIV